MFGNKTTTGGTAAVFSGLAGMVLQTLISRKIAGRAAGVAVRGGGGIPGLLLWIGISYAINRYLHRRPAAAR